MHALVKIFLHSLSNKFPALIVLSVNMSGNSKQFNELSWSFLIFSCLPSFNLFKIERLSNECRCLTKLEA